VTPGRPTRPLRRIGVRDLVALLGAWRDDRPGIPGYQALADRLRLLVLDGRLPVHALLPSERLLAQATGTSRTTTTGAYRLLRESGFASAGHGAGTWTALPRQTGADPWPVQTTGVAGTADGRGDLASAAPEAPPQLHAAYTAALAELPRYLPGHGYVTAGLPDLRQRIAARYTARGLPTTAEHVIVTAGAVHGLRLVLAALMRRGDRVLVEDPTYPLALDAVRRGGGRPVAVPVERGWDVEAYATTARRSGATLAYLMPDFQNPTGHLMDGDTRASMAAALDGCTVVVDETTVDLDLRAALGGGASLTMPAPFAAYGPPSRTVCLGSASKTFWGGLRVGWVRAEPDLVRRLVLARALDDLGSPLMEQLATAHLLGVLEGPDGVLPARRAALAARCRALTAAIEEHLPGWRVPVPDGGMVLWCTLPTPSSTAVAAAAREVGVTLTPGPRFGADGGLEYRLRIPFSRPAPELEAAVRLIAGARPAQVGAPLPEPVVTV